MVVNDLIDLCDNSQQYLNKEKCDVLNKLMRTSTCVPRIVFGNVLVKYGFYVGLVESNYKYKYYCNLNDKIVDYKEFDDIYEAVTYLFDVVNSFGNIVNSYSIFKTVTKYLDIHPSRKLKLRNNADIK